MNVVVKRQKQLTPDGALFTNKLIFGESEKMLCRHYEYELVEQDRYFINSKEHNNCVLCLVNDKGAMSLEEIGKYFGLSKMRISQICKSATEKLSKKLKKYNF